MTTFTEEQTRAYERYIKARDKVGLVRTKGYGKRPWIRTAQYDTVDMLGMNHPLFERNDDWFEYLDASSQWWAVEPESRKSNRMSAIRGDYGTADSWNEDAPNMRDTYSILQEEE